MSPASESTTLYQADPRPGNFRCQGCSGHGCLDAYASLALESDLVRVRATCIPLARAQHSYAAQSRGCSGTGLDAPASLSSGHESFSESAPPCRANLKPVILLNATDVPARTRRPKPHCPLAHEPFFRVAGALPGRHGTCYRSVLGMSRLGLDAPASSPLATDAYPSRWPLCWTAMEFCSILIRRN
jgi:hypothetical protein